jgi:hypothetical protein
VDEITELISRLESLTAEEMSRLTELVNQQFDAAAEAEPTPENVALMDQLLTAAEQVKIEGDTRAAAQAEAIARAEEMRARMEALRNPEEEEETVLIPDATAEDETEGEDEETEEAEEVAPVEGETTEEAEPALPIAAAAVGVPAGAHSAPRAARMAARHRPQLSPDAPVLDDTSRGPVIVAGAGLRDLNPGDPIEDRIVLASAMCDMLNGLDRNEPSTGRHTVARSRWYDAYPEDRRLGRDPTINGEKIGAVCGPTAVVASGGVCLPVNVDYSVPTWATADRPLRDGLPSFQADRGGLRYVAPPDIGVVDLQASPSGLGSATGIWTEATDASPASATKPVYHVACGTETLVYVDAIPTRVGFGNMQGRFAPEQIAANTDLAIAAAAREQELNLLTNMYKLSKQVQPDSYLGASRDLLATADLLVQQYRYSHRIPESLGFTAVMSEWMKALLRSDIVREVAHDNAGSINVWAITDAQIEEWLRVRGITNVIWTIDSLKAGTYGTGGQAITDQFFPIITAGAGELVWPGQSGDTAFRATWLLYPEGAFQHLDGGRLDLGVVRDSTLDATNDYESFVEVFENVALRGLEAYQVQSLLLPTGGSAGTVAVTSYEQ